MIFPATTSRRRFQPLATIAASLAVIVVAGLAYRFCLMNRTPHPDSGSCPAQTNQEISEDDRLAAFAVYWKEADYNFAYFDRAPDVDWPGSFVDYSRDVMSACTDLEYVRHFQKVVAQLNEAHTFVRLPKNLAQQFAVVPPIRLANFKDKALVVNVDAKLAGDIPPGSEILAVNGKTVLSALEENVFPYLSASTEQGRWERGVAGNPQQGLGLLVGPRDQPLELEVLRPDGDVAKTEVMRDSADRPVTWVRPTTGEQVFEMLIIDDGILLIRLNSFLTEEVVDQFLSSWEEIKRAKAIIIDIRDNRGGNSDYGAAIARHFSHDPIVGSPWKTRRNVATYRAWGKFANQYPPFKPYQPYWESEAWLVSEPDIIDAAADAIAVPIAVLISAKTYSAAEDFAIMMKSVPNTIFVGAATAGSTGQPLFLDLSGGVRAQITTRRATMQDGTEFIGVGIQPDIEVVQSPLDVNTSSDAAVIAALDYLRSH